MLLQHVDWGMRSGVAHRGCLAGRGCGRQDERGVEATLQRDLAKWTGYLSYLEGRPRAGLGRRYVEREKRKTGTDREGMLRPSGPGRADAQEPKRSYTGPLERPSPHSIISKHIICSRRALEAVGSALFASSSH